MICKDECIRKSVKNETDTLLSEILVFFETFVCSLEPLISFIFPVAVMCQNGMFFAYIHLLYGVGEIRRAAIPSSLESNREIKSLCSMLHEAYFILLATLFKLLEKGNE